jgi:hypothetical protein
MRVVPPRQRPTLAAELASQIANEGVSRLDLVTASTWRQATWCHDSGLVAGSCRVHARPSLVERRLPEARDLRPLLVVK